MDGSVQFIVISKVSVSVECKVFISSNCSIFIFVNNKVWFPFGLGISLGDELADGIILSQLSSSD